MDPISATAAAFLPMITGAAGSILPAAGSGMGGFASSLLPAAITSGATEAMPSLLPFLGQASLIPEGTTFASGLSNVLAPTAAGAAPSMAFNLGSGAGNFLMGAGKDAAKGLATGKIMNTVNPSKGAQAPAPQYGGINIPQIATSAPTPQMGGQGQNLSSLAYLLQGTPLSRMYG